MNRTILGESYDYGFVVMVKSKVVAKIEGKNIVIKGGYTFFNARNSFDALQRWNTYHGLNFSWQCESDEMDVPVLENKSEEDSLFQRATPFVDVKINTTWLKQGGKVILTLTVTRHNKTATTRKVLVVYDEPVFTLR